MSDTRIGSASRQQEELTRAVARYHAGCLRVIGAQNVALRDVRTTKKAALCCDVGMLSAAEQLLNSGRTVVSAPEKPEPDATDEELGLYHRRLVAWARLRELAGKAAVDSHAKEVVYGYPLLEGYIAKKAGGKPEPVLAPLLMQSVTVAVTSAGEIVVQATDEPPRFNTPLWREAVSADDLNQIVTLGIDAQAELAAGFDPIRVGRLLTAISSVFPAVSPSEPTARLSPWPEALGARERPDSPWLALHDGGVLFLANRSSPYLLADLQAIGENPRAVLREDSPLQVLMSEPDTAPGPEVISPNIDGVVYPFPSNAAQRQVADALDKNRVVVVQGPPGNGKSLTIANLVAHLVAHGKSVLVTSHKTQALTVVRDKLAETEQKFLFATLIGDGAHAKRELQRQIADVKAFAGAANRSKLERQMTDIENRRRSSGERYRALRHEYVDRAEAEQQEAAHRMEQMIGVPLMDPRDPAVPEGHRARVAEALRQLDDIARTHCVVWKPLVEATNESDDLVAAAGTLGEFLRQQRARLASATDPEIRVLVQAWHDIADAAPMQLDAARAAVHQIRAAMAAVLAEHPSAGRIEGSALVQAAPLREDVAIGVEALTEAFAAARKLAEHRDAVSAAPERRPQVLLHHAALSSLVRRRAARKWLDDHAPGAAGLSADLVQSWAAFWDAWSRVVTLAGGLAGGLRSELQQRFDPDAAQAVISRGSRALAWATAVESARDAAACTRIPLNLEEALSAADLADLDVTLLRFDRALTALEADRTGNSLKNDAVLGFLGGGPVRLDALIDGADYAAAEEAADILDMQLAALPAVGERHRLVADVLDEVRWARAQIEDAACADDPAPLWLGELERALDVHPALLRFVEIAASPDTREIAEELSGLTSQVLRDAGSLLGGRIQTRILDGFRKPSFLASLEAFRKAISASPKRFERFEELKHSSAFDVDVLTDVFPCWVMRPEDACRVFPLRSRVFDVVIIDEASQCNPDQVIPLFARADRAIIVGDDKQLSNEDLRRSLSGDANRALIRQAGLDSLDRVGMFDQTQNSLLDLAARRQQAQVLLNEHFRCRPEIVAFSNKAFYGNTLSVIRDREDDRGLGPALLVRQAVRGDGQPIVATGKVNHLEAQALLIELQRRLADPRYDGMTFGVLSLFREQIEHLAVLVEREIPDRERAERRIICSTVDGFQGDERDVILYSWRYASGDHPAMFAFTNGGGGEQRTNVALTRARHQSIHVISLPVDEFPASARNVTDFLRHASDPDAMLDDSEAGVHREPGGRARDIVREHLTANGLKVTDDYIACGVSVDLLVRDQAEHQRLAVFVDAECAEHRPVNVPERVDQHSLLERAGWSVCRLPATRVLRDPSGIVELVRSRLSDAKAATPTDGTELVVDRLVVADRPSDGALDERVLALDIAPEDRADYHWDVPSVPQRLASGEAVFMSGFEADLYECLSRTNGLKVVPQWPTRNKSIDLVITDEAGRRLAVEADGSHHHEDRAGHLIPEDRERQALLEEAGWTFCRVAHRDFIVDPTGVLHRILDVLAERPENAILARAVWTDQAVREALEETIEIAAVNTVDALSDAPESVAAAVSGRVGFDDLPLADMIVRIVEVVLARGSVPDVALARIFAEVHHIEVPSARRKPLSRFARTAKGKRYLDQAGENWIAGERLALRDEAYGDWTMNSLIERAAEMLIDHDDPFNSLLTQFYSGARVPKLAMSLVGSAINTARNQRDG